MGRSLAWKESWGLKHFGRCFWGSLSSQQSYSVWLFCSALRAPASCWSTRWRKRKHKQVRTHFWRGRAVLWLLACPGLEWEAGITFRACGRQGCDSQRAPDLPSHPLDCTDARNFEKPGIPTDSLIGLRNWEWQLAWWDEAGPADAALLAPPEWQEINWCLTMSLEGFLPLPQRDETSSGKCMNRIRNQMQVRSTNYMNTAWVWFPWWSQHPEFWFKKMSNSYM